MGSRRIKKDILFLLENNSWCDIAPTLSQYSEKDLINSLFSALCSVNELCKWHAVSSFGYAVPRLAAQDREAARIIMRRFLWSLNDESGGIGWGVPESMAEVMVHDEVLFDEYVHMLISYMRQDGPGLFEDGNYLELPALQQGLLWGIGRLLMRRGEAMRQRNIAEDIRIYLDSCDGIAQGLACWCLGMCGNLEHIENLRPLTNIAYTFNHYTDGNLREVSVGGLAQEAIKRLTQRK